MQPESASSTLMVIAHVTRSTLRSLLLAGASLATIACSSLYKQDTHLDQDTAAEATQAVPAVEYRPIPAPTMYSLLIAEMAGQRQRYDVALFHYLDQARKTRDPNVAERALRIAQYVGAADYAREASAIWLSVDPDDPSAVQAAAQVALGQKDYEKSLDLYIRFYEMTGIAQFDFYAAASLTASEADRTSILSWLDALNTTYPEHGNLLFGQALMLQSLEQNDAAIERIDAALDASPELLPAAIQKARLLARMERLDDAIDWLDDVQDDHPDNKQVAVLRARFLLQNGDTKGARNAFIDINEQFPNDPQVLLSLALLEEELENYDAAKPLFQGLIDEGTKANEAHFYLGRIATAEEQPELAVSHYRAIGDSREFMAGQLAAARILNDTQTVDAAVAYLDERATAYPKYAANLLRIETDLLIKAGRQQEAYDALTRALENAPTDADLLYTRAIVSEQMGDLLQLEMDLKRLLEAHPDHAEALNALGYSLANKTDRFDEAEPLIERALALQPDNPAIIDSLGWLYFRQGKINEAGPLLLDAWNKMPDHEIAAHLGEWYWVTGQPEEAKAIWKAGYDNDPESSIITETLERLKVDRDSL